jgi:hypothetical protein
MRDLLIASHCSSHRFIHPIFFKYCFIIEINVVACNRGACTIKLFTAVIISAVLLKGIEHA